MYKLKKYIVSIFYTKNLTIKVILCWVFSTSEMSEKKAIIPLFEYLKNFILMVFQMKWKSNQDMAPTFPYNFENVILCNYIGTYS